MQKTDMEKQEQFPCIGKASTCDLQEKNPNIITNDLNCINLKIKLAINQYKMLDNVKNIIVGVSGGSDSMTLLKFFLNHKEEYGINIIVAHVNHCLRGKESDRDENFVKSFCKSNNVHIEILRIDVKREAKIHKKSLEECARNVRYGFFNKLVNIYGGKIATAHTLSDSVETFLINLSRGSGTLGLCGIHPVRSNIIRPLIFLKKSDTQNYCDLCHINYVIDSTNLMNEYTRNKIRLNIIPEFKKINLNLEKSISKTMFFLRQDESYFDQILKKILINSKISDYIYKLDYISNQPYSILSRCIRKIIFNSVKINISFRQFDCILEIIKNGIGSLDLSKDVKINVKNNLFYVCKNDKKNYNKNINIAVSFKPGEILINNTKKFLVKIVNKFEFCNLKKNSSLLFFYALDYDTITVGAKFRTRLPGDKFCQAGRGVTKSIKKLFNEQKIPLSQRNSMIMLANFDNQILWIEGIGISEAAKVNESTKKVVLICPGENLKC